MRRAAFVVLALLLAPFARAGGPDAKVLEDAGKWESGYGAKFYNVVGRLKNTSDHPLQFVKLRIELLDESGKVVASTETWNEEAEVLGVPEADGKTLLAQGKIKPVAAGTEQRFRGSFLDEETPPFTTYRVLVIETPAAR
jgi:hypothetical protein